jgi:hypothetical protein
VIKPLAILALAASALIVAGCSATPARSYSSLSAVEAAYVKAGGACANEQPIPSSLTGSGIHAELCNGKPLVIAVYFDSDAAKQKELASVLGAGTSESAVVGSNWAILGASATQYAKKLGGAVQKSS